MPFINNAYNYSYTNELQSMKKLMLNKEEVRILGRILHLLIYNIYFIL